MALAARPHAAVRIDEASIARRAALFTLSTSFTLSEILVRPNLTGQAGEAAPVPSAALRLNNTNIVEALRDRPWMPLLLVALCEAAKADPAAAAAEVAAHDIRSVLVWSVSNHSYEETALRCPKCPPHHPVFSCRISEPGKTTFGGWVVPGLVSPAGAAADPAQAATLAELAELAGKTVSECRGARVNLSERVGSDSDDTRTPVSAFGTLARLDGAGPDETLDGGRPQCGAARYGATFPLVIRCNSHYHNSLPFYVHVQVLEFSGGALVGVHQATSRPIKVVSKFLALNALPDVPADADDSETGGRKRRRGHGSESARKRRRGTDWDAVSGSSEHESTGSADGGAAASALQELQSEVATVRREMADMRQREDGIRELATALLSAQQQLQSQVQVLTQQVQLQNSQVMQVVYGAVLGAAPGSAAVPAPLGAAAGLRMPGPFGNGMLPGYRGPDP